MDLSYYVLSYNEDKNFRTHFEQVVPMLECFEQIFGKYPFWNDGFSLVETPYLGMEHQSAVALEIIIYPDIVGICLILEV